MEVYRRATPAPRSRRSPHTAHARPRDRAAHQRVRRATLTHILHCLHVRLPCHRENALCASMLHSLHSHLTAPTLTSTPAEAARREHAQLSFWPRPSSRTRLRTPGTRADGGRGICCPKFARQYSQKTAAWNCYIWGGNHGIEVFTSTLDLSLLSRPSLPARTF